MTAWRTTSLQWRLTLSLLFVTTLVWALVLVMTWFKTEHELSELLDAHLAQTAAVLAVQTSDEHDDDFTTAAVLHKYQPRVAFQIWHEKDLIFRSNEAPLVPLAPLGQSGISNQWQAQQAWRVFATPGRESDVWVVVAELQTARNDILNAGLQSAIVPMLLALPVLALLIWGTIFQSLGTLRQLSQTVAQRHPDARQPLSEVVSAEVQPLVRALNRLFDQMAQQMDGERRFTADAAHELRTPIAAIRMQAQVAQGATDAAITRPVLSQLVKEVADLSFNSITIDGLPAGQWYPGQYQVSRNGGAARTANVNVGTSANVDFVDNAGTATLDTVTVVGIRKGIEDAISVKKNSTSIVEAISAEDIGKLPDATVAESISRAPELVTRLVAGHEGLLRGLVAR